MTKYQKALRTGSSLTVKLKGGKEMFFAWEIRGALVWPTAKTPGYCCILCQKEQFNDAGKAPLVLLSETEEQKPMELFKKMMNHAHNFSCSQWIVDLRRENRDYINLFNQFSRFNQISYITLTRAKFPGHFERAVGLIRDWAGSLEIHKGIMRQQLGRVTADDLSRGADPFYAIKALCFLISDLETEPWRIHSFGQGGVSQGHKNIDRRNSGGWT
jgi:hypothetical protein